MIITAHTAEKINSVFIFSSLYNSMYASASISFMSAFSL